MDIHQIETFVSIAQLGRFSRAAGRLHRSQPAISRRMSLLEQELGAPLLERVQGRVQLTDLGRKFLPYAEAILAAMHDGEAAVRTALHNGPGHMSLAIVGTLVETPIIELLQCVAAKSPTIRLDLHTATSPAVSQMVRCGEVALGIRYFIDSKPDLKSLVIGQETLVPVLSPEHPLAHRRSPDRLELQAERWIGFPITAGQTESLGRVQRRQLGLIGLSEADVMTVDSLTAQKRLAAAGFGIALLPMTSVREEFERGKLSALGVPALRTAIPISVVYRRNGYLSQAAQALLARLREPSAWSRPIRGRNKVR